ncbi:MAG TPA: hypothetical protein PLU36_10540, partial [Chitinophagaceae bacterium]|nr:hypothetical protein [Chitinophagaceae bacterium]
MKQNLKKLIFSCLLITGISTSKLAMAQSPCTTTTNSCNYLSNGGFENMDGLNCDDLHATGASVYCIGNNLFTDNTFHGCSWTAGGWTYSGTAQTADYFNACASTCWVPGVNSTDNHGSNGIGSISPHDGNGYAGIFVYTSATAFPGGSASYKESIKQTLSTPLIAGKTYIVSMWVRLAHISKYAVSDFWLNGINFTSSPITDKNNWTFLSTCYTPTATVTQIEIGSNATTLTDLDPTGTSYGTNYGQLNTVSYYYIDDVSIKPFNVNAGPDIISLFPGCGTQIGTANGGYSCLPAGATIAYNWSPSTGLSASNVATPIASPNATTNYTVTATVTYTNEAGVTAVCSSTDAVLVDVVTPTINITPSFTCNFNGVSSFTATPSPAGSYTYSWTVKDVATGTVVAVAGSGTTSATPSFSLHNVIRPVNICVSITNIYGCISTPTCYYLPNCCPTGTNIINYANTTYSTSTVLASATGTNAIVLSGTITVNSGGTLIISSKEVLMNPNTKIVLNGSGKISIASDYVHGCNYMWDGIYANGSTSGVTINNSRVEDAKRVVIDSLGGASVTLLNSYLNKNNMGIVFKATKTSASVVSIKNTLLTCASISTAGIVPKIPTAVNLTNAVTLGAFTSTVMLPPYNNQKSYCGIYFENASHTGKANAAITIGGTTGQENVFDKMQHGAFVNISKAN